MSSLDATKVVKISINLTKYFNLITLRFSTSRNVFIQCKRNTRSDIAWQAIFIISVFYSFLEFVFSFKNHKLVNFFNLYFHGFQLFTKVTVVGYYLAFKCKSHEICLLLNNILLRTYKRKGQKDLLFFAILFSCFSSTTALYAIVIPVTSLIFPCAHQVPIKISLFNICTLRSYQFAVLIFSFICMIPNALLGSLVISTCFVVLRELLHQIKQLRYAKKLKNEYILNSDIIFFEFL